MSERPNEKLSKRPNEKTIIRVKKTDKDVIYGVYIKSLLTKRVILSITEINFN